jgi:hypothetical protein
VGAAAFGALLGLPAPAPAQGRPDCALVLRKLHDISGHDGAGTPDAEKVAKKLDTDADWVERCAQSYGRRVKHHDAVLAGDSDKEFSEKREVEEFDEISREERETAGDKYFTVIEDDDAERRRLRASRDEDTSDEWEEMVTHEWEPNLGHAWQPYLNDDDHPNEE